MINLEGQVAVVTGGKVGIGAATTQQLLAAGATVVIADHKPDAARDIAAGLGSRCHALGIDVRDSGSVRAVVDDVTSRFGGLHIWVNNAAVVENAPALEMTDDGWRATLLTNLDGTFFGAREAGRYMASHGGGSIVNVSSAAGFGATRPENHVAYDVSKAAVAHMVVVLASEWAQYGIRVNAVAPGYTNTAILRDVGSRDPATMSNWLSQIPQNRLIEPAEIGRVITFLASSAASSITGQVVHADAGYAAW